MPDNVIMKKIAASKGDQTDLGGKIPQFDAFASFAYKALVNNNLVWIRIADPEAHKADDIQYCTHTTIHAYQVKWSNKTKPQPFSYNDFFKLLREMADSWKALKVFHEQEHKPLAIHLLSNRPISKNDSIKTGATTVGSFQDFYNQAWLPLKTNGIIPAKWKSIIKKIQKETGLTDGEFPSFINDLQINLDFAAEKFRVGNIHESQKYADLILFSRRLLEVVAGIDEKIQFSTSELIKSLGWEDRFKTTFNHELLIDRSKYQPIHETTKELNNKLDAINNGYIFLMGGPGSGKSTLLTEWSRGRDERIIKYYAFDFTSPSSQVNYSERGEAVNLFFDLVLQLRASHISGGDTIPYKDINVLRSIFSNQLQSLSDEFKTSAKKAIIIIDGLDHVPREYATKQSFLSELLAPQSIPEGVVIILGSQTYDHESLQKDVKIEWEKGNSTISIAPLEKREVFAYIDSSELSFDIDPPSKEQIFQISQGRPLFLSYLISKIQLAGNIEIIEDFKNVDGDINSYYKKIWLTISPDTDLVSFLGLISRIKGNINPQFIEEWGIHDQVLFNFKQRAVHLFDKSDTGWTFFHNSFRQFLIFQTSTSILTGQFDQKKHEEYHKQLAKYYNKSQIEKTWLQLYHLYSGQAFKDFIELATPEHFIDQLLNYRPPEEIRDDINLGIEISKLTKDVYCLVRYLFAASELQRRIFNLDPTVFAEEFLAIGKFSIAKSYLRDNNRLRCSKRYALKASKWFYELGDKLESKLLYSLAEPDEILADRIKIAIHSRYEDIHRELHEWASTAILFEPLPELLKKIKALEIPKEEKQGSFVNPLVRLKSELLSSCAEQLFVLSRWEDFEAVLETFNSRNKWEANAYYFSLIDAIDHCISIQNLPQAQILLKKLLTYTKGKDLNYTRKLQLADLIYKVTSDIKHAGKLINDLSQPELPKADSIGFDTGINAFVSRIRYNKLLNVSGKGESIVEAVPDGKADQVNIVEFERMLCLITQVLTDGIQGKKIINIVGKLTPAIRFYYKTVSHRDHYWYRLTRTKGDYFLFLISATARTGKDQLSLVVNAFIEEFKKFPKYWESDTKRKILLTAFEEGVDKEIIKAQLHQLEKEMLDEKDISGRVDECKLQANAWIKVKEFNEAENSLKNAILHSTGVGYRKDYQFNTWIDWLGQINAVDPDNAAPRILWFTSKLREIKETTEGRAFYLAASSLLETTFKHNTAWGFELFEWQIKNGLIDFFDGVEACLKTSIEQANDNSSYVIARDIFDYIILYLTKSEFTSLFESLLDKAYGIMGDGFFDKEIPYLINSIKLRAVEEHRKDYYAIIYRFCETFGKFDSIQDLNIEQVSTKKNTSTNELTIRPNYQTISESQVREKVVDFETFKTLLTIEDGANSRFQWSAIFDQISPFLTKENLKELLPLMNRNSRTTDLCASLAKRAVELKDLTIATEYADKAFASSTSAGWQKFYDGGTRITAMNTYKAISPAKGTDMAFAVFSDDVLSSEYPSSYTEGLDEILPVISPDLDIKKIWTEIEGYLHRLMKKNCADQILPKFAQNSNEITVPVRLLFFLLKNPVSEVKSNAKKIIIHNLENSADLQAQLKLLSEGPVQDQENYISIMLGILAFNKELLSSFRNETETLTTSQHFFLAHNAGKILKAIDDAWIPPAFKKKELNPIYSLTLSKPGTLVDEKLIEAHGFVKDTDNPFELIKPYGFWVKALSNETGISQANLAYRWRSLMFEIDSPEHISSEYEKGIRANLEEIDLQYSYPRPRTLISERALNYLVTELIGAGVLIMDKILRYFRFYDHSIDFIVTEIEKPLAIPQLHEDSHRYITRNWVSQLVEYTRLPEPLTDYKPGWKIIGEYTKQTSLNWGLPTQIFMMDLSVGDAKDPDETHEIFGYVFDKYYEDYYTNRCGQGSPFIIVYNDNRFGNFDTKTNWLAINPNLAFYLGWIPDKTRLFGWKDMDGNPLAESVFWAQGNMKMRPPMIESESGEGWLVIVAEDALADLEEIHPAFRIEKRIQRQYNDDGNFVTDSFDQITDLTSLSS